MVDHTKPKTVWTETIPSIPRPWELTHSEWLSEPSTRQWSEMQFRNTPGYLTATARNDLRGVRNQHLQRIFMLLNELYSRREAVYKINAILSPIRILPPEILSQILIIATPDDFAFRIDSQPRNNLLLVCRAWRECALATPQLWCKFDLDFKPALIRHIKAETMHDRAKQWMMRARGLPWEISTRGAVHEEPVKATWNLLVSYVRQWRVWNHRDDSEAAIPFLQVSKEAIQLTELSIIDYNTQPPLTDIPSNVLLPKLKVANLQGKISSAIPHLSASHLSELTLHQSITILSMVATMFPLLTTLTFRVQHNGVDTVDLNYTSTAQFPSLTSFTWQSEACECDIRILQAMPKLEEVALWSGIIENSRGKALHTVTKLTLGGCNLSLERAEILLNYFPSITTLLLLEHRAGGVILRALVVDDPQNATPPCPQLRSLHMIRSNLERQALFAFAKQRAPSTKAKMNRRKTFARCLLTLDTCSYVNHSDLPMVENADWRIIKKLRSMDGKDVSG